MPAPTAATPPRAILWGDSGSPRRAIAYTAADLADAVAARLPGGRVETLVPDDIPIAIVERGWLVPLGRDRLARLQALVLLAPTDEERAEAVQALAGHDGARLTVIPAPSTIAAAEHTLLLMLAVTRRLLHGYSAIVTGQRHPVRRTAPGNPLSAPNWAGLPDPPLLSGRTLGIIGLGDVGQAVASRARALEMTVVYTDRHRRRLAEARGGLLPRRLAALLREADVVSLHLPLTPETERIIDAPELALMKPDAILINTAHGRLIDEGALVKALAQGAIGGAGLDVFAYEPLPTDSPLLRLDNVVLTPHVAGLTPDTARELAARRLADALRRLVDL